MPAGGRRSHAHRGTRGAARGRRRRSLEVAGADQALRRHHRRRRRRPSRAAAGEILGLIGPNGAGKTTLFDLDLRVPARRRADASSSRATTSPTAPPTERAGSGWAARSRTPASSPSLTVAETIAVALERHVDVRDPLDAGAAPAGGASTSEADVARRVDELIELLGLGAYRDKFVRELSTGSPAHRRPGHASLAHDPKVLLLDEPSSGIAQRETEALGPLLLRIRTRPAARCSSSSTTCRSSPRCPTGSSRSSSAPVVLQGPAEEVMSDPRVITSYLGGDLATIERSGGAPPSSGCRLRIAPPLGLGQGGAVMRRCAAGCVVAASVSRCRRPSAARLPLTRQPDGWWNAATAGGVALPQPTTGADDLHVSQGASCQPRSRRWPTTCSAR